MKKLMKCLLVLALVLAFGFLGSVMAQKEMLSQGLIRFHVVGASDSEQDQYVKLQVRDAVTGYLQENMPEISNAEEATAWLQKQLPSLTAVANTALRQQGSPDTACVTLCREEFPIRAYDTFTLPSGIYSSLRVTIGEGAGQNWWCVVFPSFCLNATSESFAHTAAGAGFSDDLTHTIAGDEGYELSFFILDCLGRLENFFHFGSYPYCKSGG